MAISTTSTVAAGICWQQGLRQIAQPWRSAGLRQAVQRLLPPAKLPPAPPRDSPGLHQRGLARAIGAQHADQLALGRAAAAQAMQEGSALVLNPQAPRCGRCFTMAGRSRRSSRTSAAARPSRAVTTPMGRMAGNSDFESTGGA